MSLPRIYTNDIRLGNGNNIWDLGVTGGSYSDYDIYSGQLGPAGITGPVYSLVKYPVNLNRGKTLVVDSVKGDDTYGLNYPYSYPFKTVQKAIDTSVSGDTVFLYPGVYDETITVKSGIAVRGINTQTVSISKTNVVSNTTLVTLDSNCRIEDMTMNLTGATGGITLTGVNLINTAPQTAKIRTTVVNVSNYDTHPSVAYGVLSSGTTSNITKMTSSNAIRASTINVNLGSTGSTGCALLVSGSNLTTCRDTNFFANGPTGYNGDTGTHIIGCCINSAIGSTGALGLYSSTLSGATYDIAKENGNILFLGFSDLVNNTTNGNSFNVATQANAQAYGVAGNFNGADTFFLVPGSVSINDAPNTDYSVAYDQNLVIIGIIINWQGASIPVGQTIVVDIYKNSSLTTPLYIGTLNSTTSSIIDRSKSFTILSTDTILIKAVISGAIGRGTLVVTLAQY
jgi:hypothetical protein